MDKNAIIAYIASAYDGIDIICASDNHFFFYNPASSPEPDHRLPFATLVTSDEYDLASQLTHPSIYRLSIGVGQATYRELFGPPPKGNGSEVAVTGHDYTALDELMPHPIYAPMAWVCVLAPSETTFEAVKPLLAGAYTRAVRRHETRANRGAS